MADRVAVMEGGKLLQIGAPNEVYNNPATGFVATFLGETSAFRGTVASLDGALAHVKLDAGFGVAVCCTEGLEVGHALEVSIRPERVLISRTRPAQDENVLPGTIDFVSYLGSHVVYMIRVDGSSVPLRASEPVPFGRPNFEPGERVFCSWQAEQCVYVRS